MGATEKFNKKVVTTVAQHKATVLAWQFLCAIIASFYMILYVMRVQNSFHHPNLTRASWMKSQTKAPNSLQPP